MARISAQKLEMPREWRRVSSSATIVMHSIPNTARQCDGMQCVSFRFVLRVWFSIVSETGKKIGTDGKHVVATEISPCRILCYVHGPLRALPGAPTAPFCIECTPLPSSFLSFSISFRGLNRDPWFRLRCVAFSVARL